MLRDLGEFAILENLVFPIAKRFGVGDALGDDCGFISVGGALLAVSADVGPRPLVQQLSGHENDQEAGGWHAVVATASDIATAGAKPLFMVDTIDAPADLQAADLEAFLEGYFRACSEFGFASLGGDLRQGPTLAARVFGAGLAEHGRKIGRGGASPGDHALLLGSPGAFISAFLEAEQRPPSSVDDRRKDVLRFPRAQLREMQAIARHGLAVAASDSSDGVLGALENIGGRSGCAFHLDLDSDLLPPELTSLASQRGYDPWNLFFFWGDWSVVVVIPADKLDEFRAVASGDGIKWTYLGRALPGPFSLTASTSQGILPIHVLRNENFVDRGFNAGVRNHVDHMLTAPLFHSKNEPASRGE